MWVEFAFLFFLAISWAWPAQLPPTIIPLAQLRNWGRSYLIRLINLTNYQAAAGIYDRMGQTDFDLFAFVATKSERHSFFGSGRVVLAILLIDLVGYIFHFAMHRVRFLKKVHAVHHVEEHVSVFTALRAHPIEVFIFVVCDILIVLFLTCTQSETEIAFVTTGLFLIFTHANWRLPKRIEDFLGVIFVTSGHHQWHHVMELQNGRECNYATVFTFWDRIFGSYRAPNASSNLQFGIAGLSSEKTTLADLLLMKMRSTSKH